MISLDGDEEEEEEEDDDDEKEFNRMFAGNQRPCLEERRHPSQKGDSQDCNLGWEWKRAGVLHLENLVHAYIRAWGGGLLPVARS